MLDKNCPKMSKPSLNQRTFRKAILERATRIQEFLDSLALSDESFKAVGIELLNSRRMLFKSWKMY